MGDEVDPPRKHYQFRPANFERVNSPAAESAADSVNQPPSVPLVGRDPFVNRSNDVHQMLRENLERANAAGINHVNTFPRRRSRRTRDYWLILVLMNGFFVSVAFGPYRNPMTLTYGVAGIIVTTLGLTWVMWFVMDDY